jgi:hypothetical protein
MTGFIARPAGHRSVDARHQDEIPHLLEPYQRRIMILMIQATAHGASKLDLPAIRTRAILKCHRWVQGTVHIHMCSHLVVMISGDSMGN